MALSTQPYKGARDFYPEDKRLQKYIFGRLRKVVELFGYEEYDAPILESAELYLAKSSQEIVNEQTYFFEDRGGRQVVIRPEMTPSVSRMVAGRRQELAYPLRWYSIPNLWRYERPQHGRLREHWQLNVDLFGVDGIEAEKELIVLADAIFKDFGASQKMYSIRLNSRKFIDFVLKGYLGLDSVQSVSMIRLIDRMAKMDRADFMAQIDALASPSQRESGLVEKLLEVINTKKISNLPAAINNHPTLIEINLMTELLEANGVHNVEFDVTLMRGFDYYTDIVFEIFDTHPDNNRSILGGGRYDGLVSQFGVDPIPTVGFGLGDVTLANFLEVHQLLPKLSTETDLYAVIVGEILEDAHQPIAELRSAGVNVAVEISARSLNKQIATADKKGIEYVIIIGPQEIKEARYILKNLQSGQEEKHSIARIVSIIEDLRRSRLKLED